MSERTNIAWTEATWNPVTGCSKVSPGCANCYAEALSLRYGWTTKPWTPEHAAENVVLHPDRLGIPLRWKQPRRVFVNSMSDLFHAQVPDDFIDKIFAIMTATPYQTYQLLTKRPARMAAYVGHGKEAARRIVNTLRLPDLELDDEDMERAFRGVSGIAIPWPLPNVWLGVSVENQRMADERIPLLLETPAAVRFLSCEPLLGPLDLRLPYARESIGWVIIGGESGPNRRDMDLDWARDIVRQCDAAGVPVFFKQRSAVRPGMPSGDTALDGRKEMP